MSLVIGSTRYREMKETAAQLVIDQLPDTPGDAQNYTMIVIDLEGTIVEKVSQLDNVEYDSILRQVFTDFEQPMISVGAVLGGIVGRIRVQNIEYSGH